MSSTAYNDQWAAIRDRLLTKLAMDLAEWPVTAEEAKRAMPEGWYWRGDDGAIHVGGGIESFAVAAPDWLQRRTELINKPSWEDAPEWAQWLAQDESGTWHWYGIKPEAFDRQWDADTKIRRAIAGGVPAGHDWRDTLEKRPMDLYDMQDTIGDAWARDRREVIDEMAREVCPTQWREGGHMRYKGHTITWGEYVQRRHEIEDEEEEGFTVEEQEHDFNDDGGPLEQAMREQMQRAAEKWQRGEMEATGNQARYQDSNGDDWIDEFARTATPEEFRGAMRFSLGKYNRRAGKKDELTSEIRKMRDYCDRWLAYEEGDA